MAERFRLVCLSVAVSSIPVDCEFLFTHRCGHGFKSEFVRFPPTVILTIVVGVKHFEYVVNHESNG